MPFVLGSSPSPQDVSLAQTVGQLWNSGQQQQAVDQLSPRSTDGERWAVALEAWLRMQMVAMGPPNPEQALASARRAASLGMYWPVAQTVGNIIGNSQMAPDLLEPALAMLSEFPGAHATSVDPAGSGWNLISQGNVEMGLRLLGSFELGGPHDDASWSDLSSQLRERVDEVSEIASLGDSARASLVAAVEDAKGQIEAQRQDVETSAKQAGMLVTTVLSESANELFKEDAKNNQKESSLAWKWGLIVLAAAAAIAVLPLLLHYLRRTETLDGSALLAAHAASAAAFATVAGVLLARARNRDRARQRANDLSTAMGTMISYSNQIQNPTEKQAFMLTMGQLVLHAHLTGGAAPSGEDNASGLVALANAMRQSEKPQ